MSFYHIIPMTMRDDFLADPFFRNAWADLDRIHREMSNETRNYWRQTEQQQQGQVQGQVQGHVQGQQGQVQGEVQGDGDGGQDNNKGQVAARQDSGEFGPSFAPWFFPRRWLLPSLHGGEVGRMDRRLKALNLFQDPEGDKGIIRQTDDREKFEVSIDTHGFKPEELHVKVDGNRLTVEGKHETKEKDRYVSRQFVRSYTLPAGCLLDKVSSNLSTDGVLMVTAPKQQLAIEKGAPVNVPIEVEKK